MRQFQDDWKQAEAQALPTDEERGTKLRPLHQEDVSSTVELTEPLASARQLSYLLVKYSTRLTTTDQQMLAFIQQEREIELASRLTQHLLHPMKNTQGETVTAGISMCSSCGVSELEALALGFLQE